MDVTVDGSARAVRGLRRKAVLAVLALHPGEIVSTGRLIDAVWDERAPATAANTLQSHVSHLRVSLPGRHRMTSDDVVEIDVETQRGNWLVTSFFAHVPEELPNVAPAGLAFAPRIVSTGGW